MDHVTGIMVAQVFVIVTKTTEGKRINVDIAAKSLMVVVTGKFHQVGILR